MKIDLPGMKMTIMRNVLAKGLFIALLTGPAAYAVEPVSFTVDVSSPGKIITNKFSDINMWMIDRTWLQTADTYPADYFKSNFPFIERIQLMAATGGNEDRDLFKNPLDRTTFTDYDFDNLIRACESILAKGLKPMIKTGWVPLKLSANPRMSASFSTNLRPPSDYEAYYAYIKAVAEALKSRFGLEQMQDWSWGVGVEDENRDWFEAEDGQSESTMLAYCKLYDYTVSALEDALGAENFRVGAHSMSVTPGFWQEGDFIEHCAKGINYRTGKPGTKLDYLAISYYTTVPGFNPQSFINAVGKVRQQALRLGLVNLKYGVDEGRVLNGWDNLVIYPREVQHPMQAAGDAMLFQLMVDNDVDYFSTWCLTTQGLFGGIPVVSANFRNLAYRLAGSALLKTTLSGKPAVATNEVNGLAGYDAGQKVLRVMLYNFSTTQYTKEIEYTKATEDLALHISNLKPYPGQEVTVRAWRLDRENGNWWETWQNDASGWNLQAASFSSSIWTLSLPEELTNRADVDFWNSREAAYDQAGQMTYQDEQARIDSSGQLVLTSRLQPYGVLLYEIFPIEVAQVEGLREDINEDGQVNIMDVISLLLLGIKNPLDPQADYNRDGAWSIQDVVSLARDISNRRQSQIACSSDRTPIHTLLETAP